MADFQQRIYLIGLILFVHLFSVVQALDVPNEVAIIVGTILGILLIICLIIAFIFLHAAVKRDNMTTLYLQEYYGTEEKTAQGQDNRGYSNSYVPPPSAPTQASYYDNPTINPSYAGPAVPYHEPPPPRSDYYGGGENGQQIYNSHVMRQSSDGYNYHSQA